MWVLLQSLSDWLALNYQCVAHTISYHLLSSVAVSRAEFLPKLEWDEGRKGYSMECIHTKDNAKLGLRWLTFCIAKFPIYFPLIVVKAYYKSNESQRKIILSQSYFHSYRMLLWIQKSPVEHGLFLTFAEISVCPRIYFHFSIHFRDIILKKSHRSRFFQGSWSHLQTFP